LERRAALGLVFTVSIIGIFAAVLAVFNQVFSADIGVTVQADRAGLLMDPGSLVLFRGVAIGTVGSVAEAEHGAVLHLALDRRAAARLPGNVVATLATTSLFGPKSVQLRIPTLASRAHLRSGSVIEAVGADVEINRLNQHLMSVLTTLDPARVNATLNAVSEALRGRGDELGDVVDQLDHYLTQVNPEMPALRHDITSGSDVINTYAAAAPDLIELLRNLTVLSSTVNDKSAQLHELLDNLTGLSDSAHGLLEGNGDAIQTTLELFAPTTRLLARYSAEYPCLFQGIDENRKMLEKTVGGDGRTARLTLGLLPGAEPYRYPTDLPKVAARGGPTCRSLPSVGTRGAAPYVPTDTGTNPKAGTTTPRLGDPPLTLDLFGPTAPRVGPR
jgi:phospholipid/cholesterol/gamma-HCH transport system substrate-binding protein